MSFEETVGGKKQAYLDSFFDQDDKLAVDFASKDLKFMEQLLINLYDLTVCPHLEHAHRSRFMCHSCYHGRGNNLKATKCEHTDKPHHSSGLCKACYHQRYYQDKITVRKQNLKKNKQNQL